MSGSEFILYLYFPKSTSALTFTVNCQDPNSSCSPLPASILHKAQVSKCHITELTTEAVWVPVIVHCLDHSSDNELTLERKIQPLDESKNFAARILPLPIAVPF